MFNQRPRNLRVALIRLVFSGAIAAASSSSMTATAEAASAGTHAASSIESGLSAEAWSESAIGDIDPKVFAMALEAASAAVARGDAPHPGTLTVIDFSKPSTQKRLWVFDLRSHTLLYDEVVSHGRGSGRTMATKFSNDPGSAESSLGLFRTGETYIGKHGYSLRLDGLEPVVNDRARERALVMHPAPYVNPAAARAQGYLGRSLGCPALRPEIAHELIDAVKGGGLVFAYYPDPRWLRQSRFLQCDATLAAK